MQLWHTEQGGVHAALHPLSRSIPISARQLLLGQPHSSCIQAVALEDHAHEVSVHVGMQSSVGQRYYRSARTPLCRMPCCVGLHLFSRNTPISARQLSLEPAWFTADGSYHYYLMHTVDHICMAMPAAAVRMQQAWG
jgi:hypothetical protein